MERPLLSWTLEAREKDSEAIFAILDMCCDLKVVVDVREEEEQDMSYGQVPIMTLLLVWFYASSNLVMLTEWLQQHFGMKDTKCAYVHQVSDLDTRNLFEQEIEVRLW